MSHLGWQDATVAAMAALALLWLLRRQVRRASRGAPPCEECPACRAGRRAPPELIAIAPRALDPPAPVTARPPA